GSIVVGIANKDRKRDFTYPSRRAKDREMLPTSGGSAKFIRYIEKEVQPFIKEKYAANDEATLIGQSLGGLLATEILFTRPMMFDKYVIISPSLWWDDGGLLNRNPAILKEDYKLPTAVYIGVGKEGSVDGSKEHIMERDAQKLAEKVSSTRSKKIKIYFDYLPDENHATVGHQAVFNAFRLLYPAKKK
ncbi:MAG: alpha/beta hydrolase, partial [Chitinophagaceae bacterium]|nr:alpha/beta hydrolase [Chitinophagaceae bacterium]